MANLRVHFMTSVPGEQKSVKRYPGPEAEGIRDLRAEGRSSSSEAEGRGSRRPKARDLRTSATMASKEAYMKCQAMKCRVAKLGFGSVVKVPFYPQEALCCISRV